MFGTAYFGQPYFGQGSPLESAPTGRLEIYYVRADSRTYIVRPPEEPEEQMPQYFKKQPNDNVDYRFDWTRWLAVTTDDTIVSAVVTATPAGLTLGSTIVTPLTVTQFVADGVHGINYKITCRITTAQGRVAEAEIFILSREIQFKEMLKQKIMSEPTKNTSSHVTLSWVQLIIQTGVLLSGFLVWSMAQEHRLTVIEESLKTNRQIMETLTTNQSRVIETLSALTLQQRRLETLFESHVEKERR